MPYIKHEKRNIIADGHVPANVGELTYKLTQDVKEFLGPSKLTFEKLSAAVAALECTKLELYRRVISRYEGRKIKENGDVYFYDFGREVE